MKRDDLIVSLLILVAQILVACINLSLSVKFYTEYAKNEMQNNRSKNNAQKKSD